MRVPRTDEKSTGTRDQGMGTMEMRRKGRPAPPSGVLDCGVLWREGVFLRCLGTGQGGWQLWQVVAGGGSCRDSGRGRQRVLWHPGRTVMGACSVRRSRRGRWWAKRSGCWLRAIHSQVQPRGSSTPHARPSPSRLGMLLLASSPACFRKTITALVRPHALKATQPSSRTTED